MVPTAHASQYVQVVHVLPKAVEGARRRRMHLCKTQKLLPYLCLTGMPIQLMNLREKHPSQSTRL